MFRLAGFIVLLIAHSMLATPAHATIPSQAEDTAEHAVEHYDHEQVELLAELVRFRTVHEPGTVNAEQSEFRAFAAHVEKRAREFGLDFTDLGAVLVIGLGDAEDRLGIVTHGDVQPADPSKWNKSPFELDTDSEPGRLIARGTEDNKAPIATAMYAMKTIRERGIPLERRIELIVSLTEESDWEPFREVLRNWEPPAVNVAIDSAYPVVVAEKGWGSLQLEFRLPLVDADEGTNGIRSNGSDLNGPRLVRFEGGAFMSQVPEEARLVIANADTELEQRLRKHANAAYDGITYRFEENGGDLTVEVRGKAAHSSTPEEGRNAIVHAAALLRGENLGNTDAAHAVAFTNALLGTGLYGEQFGDAAYAHPFMGPLTVNLSVAKTEADKVTLGINTRAPAGKTAAQLETDMREAIEEWADDHDIPAPAITAQMSEAYLPEQPPQVDTLLAVFRHYSGQDDAQPVSIGGGTNARLLPYGVNFGPSMPGAPYTGHSEHEFITRAQMTLNLRMYTAMMTWFATRKDL